MRAFIVAGLGFGDEGKGRMVDALVRIHKSRLVVRYNGGAQAAHHVVLPDGREHCFSQFGAGTFAGAQTYLSHYVTLDLPALMNEAKALQDNGVESPLRLLHVSGGCPVVTRYQRALNHLREIARGASRHGSCGRGMGEVARAMAAGEPVLRIHDLFDPMRAGWLLERIRGECIAQAAELRVSLPPPALGVSRQQRDERWNEAYRVLHDEPDEWIDRYAQIVGALQIGCPPLPETTVFEGAQGVLLDEWYGFHPHTTWSTCTFDNADALCREWGLSQVERIGVTRTYSTRHGAGPFPSARELNYRVVERLQHKAEHNGTGEWQGAFQIGALDLPLLDYACRVAAPDVLAVTHLDCVISPWPVIRDYPGVYLFPRKGDLAHQQRLGEALHEARALTTHVVDAQGVLTLMRDVTRVPIGYMAMGPTAEQTCSVLAGAF